MSELAEILHNIADHTETFYRFLSEPGIADDIKTRLIDHIVLEEKENSSKLHQLHGSSPSALTQKMLDHSFILQKVMSDLTMPHDLKQELLHHFMEEHQEWQMQIIGSPTGHAVDGTTTGAGTAAAAAGSAQEQHDRQSAQSHKHSAASHGARENHQAKPSTQSSGEWQPESREWTVGPLWNQGG